MRTILIIFIYFVSVSGSFADQNSSRLDPLFKELTQIKNELAADLILAEIWSIWSKTDNEMAQEIFEEGNQLMSKGQFEESILTFTEVIALQPDFAEHGIKGQLFIFLMVSLKNLFKILKKPFHSNRDILELLMVWPKFIFFRTSF